VAASEQATQTPDPDETAEPTPDSRPTEPDPEGTVSLEIGTATGVNEFKYSKDTLEAPAGSKIKLRFNNDTNAADEIGHNWVLVKPGQEESVLANGIAAGDDKDWLQEDDPGIIVNTRLIEGNQRHSITFDAPPPGTYVFVCTFPEHYAGGMKGTLTITQ
jgi:azurin